MNEDIEFTTEKSYEIKRAKHLKFSRRDTMVNDWKNSTAEGITSFILSLLAVILFLLAVYFSFRSGGQGSVMLGVLGFLSFLLGCISIVFALIGLRNRRKIRHYMEWRAIVISGLLVIGLVMIFIYGIRKLGSV